jgi:hypothetical protein
MPKDRKKSVAAGEAMPAAKIILKQPATVTSRSENLIEDDFGDMGRDEIQHNFGAAATQKNDIH